MGIELATAQFGLSVLGTGLGLIGASRRKKEAKKAQREQTAFDARSAKLQSKSILEEATLEAAEIRRAGGLLGKKQTALTAKAGLKLGTGTAKEIQEETRRLTEKDVATALESAQRKSEQLLTTFHAGKQEVVPLGELEKLREKEAKLTALESETTSSNNNFIKSKATNKALFAGL